MTTVGYSPYAMAAPSSSQFIKRSGKPQPPQDSAGNLIHMRTTNSPTLLQHDVNKKGSAAGPTLPVKVNLSSAPTVKVESRILAQAQAQAGTISGPPTSATAYSPDVGFKRSTIKAPPTVPPTIQSSASSIPAQQNTSSTKSTAATTAPSMTPAPTPAPAPAPAAPPSSVASATTSIASMVSSTASMIRRNSNPFLLLTRQNSNSGNSMVNSAETSGATTAAAGSSQATTASTASSSNSTTGTAAPSSSSVPGSKNNPTPYPMGRSSSVSNKSMSSVSSTFSQFLSGPSSTRKNSQVLPVDDSGQPVVAPAAATGGGDGKLCCDKCDGKHLTDNCPHYNKGREAHPDAQKSFYKKLGGSSTLPGATSSSATIVRQPGDGSCLFHSMSYGLKDGSTASSLRAEICAFISKNPTFKISESPLSDWVQWDSNSTCAEYARRMSGGAWGGGIEMAVLSQIKNVNVHVYEQQRGGVSRTSGRNGSNYGFKRISAFDVPVEPEKQRIVRVLYCGGVHYEALVV